MSLQNVVITVFMFLAIWIGVDAIAGRLGEQTFDQCFGAVVMAVLLYMNQE
jgi:uncharacterized membrane protein YfcA